MIGAVAITAARIVTPMINREMLVCLATLRRVTAKMRLHRFD